MGNQCSTDREVMAQEDIFDFRYQNEDQKKENDDLFAPVAKEGDQNHEGDGEDTDLPSFKDHLNSVADDPYSDKYAHKGDSVFVLHNGIEKTTTDLRMNNGIPEEDETVFEDDFPAYRQAGDNFGEEEDLPQFRVANYREAGQSQSEPAQLIGEVSTMNPLSQKGQEVIQRVNPFQKAFDPANQSNEIHGPNLYSDDSTFQGQYLNGQRQGHGMEITKNGDLYEGQWNKDRKEGFGRFIMSNGDFYEGANINGTFQGQGTFINYKNKVVSQGNFQDNLLDGLGSEEYPYGGHYEGEFRNGMKHGQGTFSFLDGSTYVGQFENDLKHGKGKI